MAYVSTVEIPGAHAHLRRTLAPPIRPHGLDTRIHSRRAIGKALQRTAVPTPVLLLEPDAAAHGDGAEAEGADPEPDRRTTP
jgi:hypothetical protein